MTREACEDEGDRHEDDRSFLAFIRECTDAPRLVRMIGPFTPAWKVEAIRRRLDAIVNARRDA